MHNNNSLYDLLSLESKEIVTSVDSEFVTRHIVNKRNRIRSFIIGSSLITIYIFRYQLISFFLSIGK